MIQIRSKTALIRAFCFRVAMINLLLLVGISCSIEVSKHQDDSAKVSQSSNASKTLGEQDDSKIVDDCLDVPTCALGYKTCTTDDAIELLCEGELKCTNLNLIRLPSQIVDELSSSSKLEIVRVSVDGVETSKKNYVLEPSKTHLRF